MDDWKMIHFQLGRLGLLSPAMLVSGSATYRYFLILHFVCSTKNVGSGPIPPSTGGLVDVGMWQWAAWQFLLFFQGGFPSKLLRSVTSNLFSCYNFQHVKKTHSGSIFHPEKKPTTNY